MIQTDLRSLVVDSPVPLMRHDPDRSWITDPNSDHPKGTHPKTEITSFATRIFLHETNITSDICLPITVLL